MIWLHWTFTAIFALLGAGCLLLVIMQLPGVWIMIGLGALVQLADVAWIHGEAAAPGWWALGIAVALAIIGEILEACLWCRRRESGWRRSPQYVGRLHWRDSRRTSWNLHDSNSNSRNLHRRYRRRICWRNVGRGHRSECSDRSSVSGASSRRSRWPRRWDDLQVGHCRGGVAGADRGLGHSLAVVGGDSQHFRECCAAISQFLHGVLAERSHSSIAAVCSETID